MTRRVYYPIFADLRGRRCVVVGGGLVAQRKVIGLRRAGADVAVISPRATTRLLAYARQRTIRHLARSFRRSDVQGAWLVVAATNDETLNTRVARSATRRRIFTNVVDQPSLCSWIAPAIVRRGLLTIAISTAGASPTLAKKLRGDLQRMVRSEYAPMTRLLGGLRTVAKQRLPSASLRKRYFSRLVHSAVKTHQQALDLLERYAVRPASHAVGGLRRRRSGGVKNGT